MKSNEYFFLHKYVYVKNDSLSISQSINDYNMYNINMLMPILFKHVNCPINVISAFDKPCILKRVGKVGLCHRTVMKKKYENYLIFWE
jgi:predicted nuclease of restriction endonuclease-like RecB superfamily